MKVLVLVCALVGYVAAKPGYLGLGLPYGVPAAVSAAGAGLPADTPEVAAAKSRILAIQAAEAARNALGVPVVPAPAPAVAAVAAPSAGLAAYRPANIVIGPGGVPLDTPEVAAAKAAHSAARAQAAAAAAAAPAAPAVLAAPAVYAPGLLGLGVAGAAQVAPDGTLLTAQGVPLDTPAVAAGKIADAVAHLQAKAALLG